MSISPLMLACTPKDAFSMPDTQEFVLPVGTSGKVGRVDWEDWCDHNAMAMGP